MTLRFNGEGPDVTHIVVVWVVILLSIGGGVGFHFGERAGMVKGRDQWAKIAVAVRENQERQALREGGGTFHGYPCLGDCSGHQAGYTWAEERAINDADECGGNSQSFIEGCKAYANEHQ